MKIKSKVHNESFERYLKYSIINKEILSLSARIRTVFFTIKCSTDYIFVHGRKTNKRSVGQQSEKTGQSCKFSVS